jgi:Tol biopolymer transport system component
MFSVFRKANVFFTFACFSAALFCGVTFAQVEVEIIADEGAKIPITVLPFEGSGSASLMSEIISADLLKTGLFAIQSVEPDWRRTKLTESDYPEWSSKDVQNLVVGKFIELDDGRIQGTFGYMTSQGKLCQLAIRLKMTLRKSVVWPIILLT